MEIEVFENLHVLFRAFQKPTGFDGFLAFVDAFVERPGIDADADGDVSRFAGIDDGFDPLDRPDIPWIYADGVDPAFKRQKRVTVFEMDVGDQRYRDAFFDFAEAFRVIFIKNGKPHDIGAQRGAAVDLRADFLDAARLDGAHALNQYSALSAELRGPKLRIR